jgi:hypothetical protein
MEYQYYLCKDVLTWCSNTIYVRMYLHGVVYYLCKKVLYTNSAYYSVSLSMLRIGSTTHYEYPNTMRAEDVLHQYSTTPRACGVLLGTCYVICIYYPLTLCACASV